MNWKVNYRNVIAKVERTAPRCAGTNCGRRYPLLNGWIGRDEGLCTHDGEWFCSPACFERGIAVRFSQLRSFAGANRQPRMNRIPLGLLLHQRGLITTEQLNTALDRHRRTGMKLGECLRRDYGISEEEIATAVAAQWSCPKFPAAEISPECTTLVPRVLVDRYRILPVRLVEAARRLYVGCTERVPYNVLYGMERMLDLRTESCIITDSAFASRACQSSMDSVENDIVMESLISPAEMARMTRSYAQQLEAGEVRYVLCGNYLWVRVHGRRQQMNLLYRPWEHAALAGSLALRAPVTLST